MKVEVPFMTRRLQEVWRQMCPSQSRGSSARHIECFTSFYPRPHRHGLGGALPVTQQNSPEAHPGGCLLAHAIMIGDVNERHWPPAATQGSEAPGLVAAAAFGAGLVLAGTGGVALALAAAGAFAAGLVLPDRAASLETPAAAGSGEAAPHAAMDRMEKATKERASIMAIVRRGRRIALCLFAMNHVVQENRKC